MIKLYEYFLMNTQLHNVIQMAEVQVRQRKLPNATLCLDELMSSVEQLGMLFSPTSSTPSTR